MGLGQHFTRAHVSLATFNDKDDTCRLGNFQFEFIFENAMKTIGYSNLLL